MLTGRAGARALAWAFEEEFGVPDGFCQIPLAGRTDAWLVAQAAAAHRLPCDAKRVRRVRAAYVERLTLEIDQPGPRKGIMPGVRQLLDAVGS